MLTIKKGDTKKWEYTLEENGTAVNLSGATVTVYTRLREETDNKVDGGAVTIADAGAGEVEYEPVAADVDTEGYYDLYWKVLFSDGKEARFPNEGFNTLRIGENFE